MLASTIGTLGLTLVPQLSEASQVKVTTFPMRDIQERSWHLVRRVLEIEGFSDPTKTWIQVRYFWARPYPGKVHGYLQVVRFLTLGSLRPRLPSDTEFGGVSWTPQGLRKHWKELFDHGITLVEKCINYWRHCSAWGNAEELEADRLEAEQYLADGFEYLLRNARPLYLLV